jgi:phosphoserine phosphatase
MDSTIINVECLDEGWPTSPGSKDKVSEITERAMRGELAFEGALRERVGMLTGLGSTPCSCYDDRVRLNPGARTLVRTMAQRRALRPGLGRLHLLHQPGGRSGGLPPDNRANTLIEMAAP